MKIEAVRNIVNGKNTLVDYLSLLEALQDMYYDATFGIKSQVFDPETSVAYVLDGDETTTDSEYHRKTLKMRYDEN